MESIESERCAELKKTRSKFMPVFFPLAWLLLALCLKAGPETGSFVFLSAEDNFQPNVLDCSQWIEAPHGQTRLPFW